MDKIVVDMDTDQRVCVSCGFSEARPGLPDVRSPGAVEQKATEIPTRVSRAAARRVETPPQAITLIDPRRPSDKPEGQGD